MFEEKKIKYFNGYTVFDAIVISCVKDVGISIVQESNQEKFLLCQNMKNSPKFFPGRGEITQTRKTFTKIRQMIINGYVDGTVLNGSKDPGATKCPFGN